MVLNTGSSYVCLPGQRRAALHWHEHFEATVNQLDFISFDGMVTVYKHRSEVYVHHNTC